MVKIIFINISKYPLPLVIKMKEGIIMRKFNISGDAYR